VDISFIDFNDVRHINYKEYEHMFNNYEDTWMQVRRFTPIGTHPYISVSLPREVCLLYSDLAFSTPINAFVKDNPEANAAIDQIIEENKLNTQLQEASLLAAYKGGCVFKNYLDNGKSKITYIQPDYYFPVFSPTDQRKILSETIAYVLQDDKLDPLKNQVMYTETYEPDANGYYWCITRTYRGSKMNSETKVNTMLKESPLTYVPFVRSGSNFWGDSIYKGLTPLFDELSHRITQIAHILDKHSDPNLIADPSFFDENNNLPMGGKAFPVEGDEQKPEYLTWNWSGDHNFKFINDIIFNILHYVSPLAPALYGMDSASQASGRSLMIKSWRAQSLVRRSHVYWRDALKKILYLAQELQNISGEKSYTPAIPNVDLTISLPFDQLEAAQAEQLKVQSKLSSIKSSIARLNPSYTNKQVEDEYLEIINEQNEINNLTFASSSGLSGNDNFNLDENKNGGLNGTN
jgi:hypothetical protein